MRKPPRPTVPPAPLSPLGHALSLGLLLAPAAALGVVAARFGSPPLGAGAVVAGLVGLWLARTPPAWRPPAGAAAVGLFLAAYGLLWAGTVRLKDAKDDRAAPLARGGLLVAAAGLLAAFDLTRTGLEPRRRAVAVAKRLKARLRWPDGFRAMAQLPEVRALRAATRDDPVPALDLLADRRAEVRLAALAALDGRPFWRPAEAAAVLQAAKTPDPGVRAAALAALGRATDQNTVGGLTGFLRDPDPGVRTAAGAALMADPARWAGVRDAVRDALAAPALAGDGPLPGVADRLSPMAVCDLTSWAAEHEPLAGRSIATLAEFYARRLHAGGSPELPAELGRVVTDAGTPTALRVELAGLLRGLDLIPPDLLDRMTDVDQPGPVRLLAAELLLAADPDDADAVDVLRGLGRQPNRETAITIARLLQTYLGMDLGLPAGPLAPQSRPAAEVAKRVLVWATTARTNPQMPAAPANGRPVSTGSTPDLDARVPAWPVG